MNRLERFYKIEQMLTARRVVPRQSFLDELGVSLATFKRDTDSTQHKGRGKNLNSLVCGLMSVRRMLY